MESHKNRTITFRLDDDVARKLAVHAKTRHTSVSAILRGWCENCDHKIQLPRQVRKKLELIARGRRSLTVGKLIENAVRLVYWRGDW